MIHNGSYYNYKSHDYCVRWLKLQKGNFISFKIFKKTFGTMSIF